MALARDRQVTRLVVEAAAIFLLCRGFRSDILRADLFVRVTREIGEMKKGAGFFFILVLLAAVLVWLPACRNDINVPYPDTLANDYEGIYAYMEIDGIDTVVDTANYVIFRFTKVAYFLTVNPKLESEESSYFCDCEGLYELENGVQFLEEDGNRTNKVCTPDNNPQGSFGLNQNTGTDTMLIKQDNTEGGIRKIKVLKLVVK